MKKFFLHTETCCNELHNISTIDFVHTCMLLILYIHTYTWLRPLEAFLFYKLFEEGERGLKGRSQISLYLSVQSTTKNEEGIKMESLEFNPCLTTVIICRQIGKLQGKVDTDFEQTQTAEKYLRSSQSPSLPFSQSHISSILDSVTHVWAPYSSVFRK